MASLGDVFIQASPEIREEFEALKQALTEFKETIASPRYLLMHVQPGDVIVVRVVDKLTEAAREKIIANLHALFPDNAVRVLDHGMDIAVMHPSEENDEETKNIGG